MSSQSTRAAPEGEAELSIRDFKRAGPTLEEITWPGTERKVGLLYLMSDAYQDAYFAARARWEDMRGEMDDEASPHFDREYSLQLCYRMLVQPGIRAERRLFRSADEARAELSPNEIDWFMDEQQRLAREDAVRMGAIDRLVSPHLRQVARAFGLDDQQGVDELVEQLTAMAPG